MYWHKRKDRSSGGLWRCSVKKREVNLRDWHGPNGGYVRRRRKQLAAQRQRILEQLDQLAQEATNVES